VKEIQRPHIDKSRIIDKDFWTFDPVVKAEKWLQDELMKPGYFDKLCAHEGAHLYYIRMIYPAAKILPPAVYYHEKKQQYVPLEAGIEFRGMDKTCDYARLMTFAKGTFAGGVLEGVHLFTHNPDMPIKRIIAELGDIDDYNEFADYCEEIRKASPGLVFDTEKLRTDATMEVAKDVATPAIRTKLDAVAEEVRNFLCAAMYPEDVAPNVSTICDSSTDSKS
jgi:hypothetical protein